VPALVDWKTGYGVHPGTLIQLVAYKTAWGGVFPDQPLAGGHLLRIGKQDASFHHRHRGALPEAREVFTHLLEIHKLAKIIKRQS
jgi:hypothetical protein